MKSVYNRMVVVVMLESEVTSVDSTHTVYNTTTGGGEDGWLGRYRGTRISRRPNQPAKGYGEISFD